MESINMNLKIKLTIAFGGLLVILLAVGMMSIRTVNESSTAIARIFRENYGSVAAGQKMKEAIGRLDRIAEVSLWEKPPDSQAERESAFLEFEKGLVFQMRNATLDGEEEVNEQLAQLWKNYRQEYEHFFKLSSTGSSDYNLYHNQILPRSQAVRNSVQAIIEMNLNNMVSVDGQVRRSAIKTGHTMLILVFSGVVLAIIFVGVVGPAILLPIESLTRSVREIQQGNLDLVVHVRSHDEIGQLAEAFNEMVTSLREFRRSTRSRFLRAQRSTQLALNSIPDAVAICSTDGKIELANDAAQRLFGMKPESTVASVGNEKITSLFNRLCQEARPIQPKGYDSAIQIFQKGEERFFLPEGIPILNEQGQLVGATLLLSDVTGLRRIDEMKSGLISTVSHELKTPLTSVRLAIHVLLSEKLGPLEPKQTEILAVARKDSDRLYNIIENLLDISRMESGRSEIQLQPVDVEQLILQTTDEMRTAFLDAGITLDIDVSGEVQPVLADPSRLQHVFDNLLGNALKYTPSGGKVTITAVPDSGGEDTHEDDMVRFCVEDTGQGIPQAHLPHIFEKFFRVPGQDQQGDSGLGMAITKEIVEGHGGHIEVQSQVGKGTKFIFTLKAAELAELASDKVNGKVNGKINDKINGDRPHLAADQV
jgi:NtrC-family two-component system sensor histidine kinase KinB